ncbi:MAG: type II toxin-antitoxin system RelE/ParE family toxin [bacterium]|nr:type II toxin-antitoxin system RelE/ParE family toxin [bacterium]
MAKKYIVNWSNDADNDLNYIIDFIAEDNIDQALKILYKIKGAADKLYRYPTRGRNVPELLIHNINTFREIVVSPWRIIYRIDESNVMILTVVDGRRNVEDVLLRKLLAGEMR